MDFHIGIVEGMTILTTTIYRTLNIRTCFRALSTNGDECVIDPSRMVVALTSLVNITSRRAEHHAVIMTICTDGTTRDDDFSRTGSCGL